MSETGEGQVMHARECTQFQYFHIMGPLSKILDLLLQVQG